jgi:putative toxin-antitoxin system antitoxin component (TIGR02293 family)
MEEVMASKRKVGSTDAASGAGHRAAEALARYVAKPRGRRGFAPGVPDEATPMAKEADNFAELVSSAPAGGSGAVEAIRAGFPAAMLKSAGRYFGVTDARMQGIVRVPATTAARLEKAGSRIDAAASERLFRMGMVTRMAIDLFGEQAAAIAWMRATNHALGDVAPLDLMDTEPGAATVRLVLNAIAGGGVA